MSETVQMVAPKKGCFVKNEEKKNCNKEEDWEMELKLFFFLVSCVGVRLSPLGTSATNWPIVPATDGV
jgi:hypothetical protein